MSATTVSRQPSADLLAYIEKCGGAYESWYCGIASDPRDCLFNRHGVTENPGAWIFRDCGTDTAARAVEQYFHRLGCQGAGGGGGPDTRFIYAYRITLTTRE